MLESPGTEFGEGKTTIAQPPCVMSAKEVPSSDCQVVTGTFPMMCELFDVQC